MTFGSFLGSFFHYYWILSSFSVHVSGQTRSYVISAKMCGFPNNNNNHFFQFSILFTVKFAHFFLKSLTFFSDLIFLFFETCSINSVENIHNKFEKEITKFPDCVRILLVGCFFTVTLVYQPPLVNFVDGFYLINLYSFK